MSEFVCHESALLGERYYKLHHESGLTVFVFPKEMSTTYGIFSVSFGGSTVSYEKNGEKYHHILNPETGTPAENDLASVTIVSENATLADAYSTALFVMGFEKAVNFYKNENNFNAIFILKNGKIYVTEGIAENFSATSFDIIY
jgi:thiamine biosynthesis lipoprotein